jgi:hypothetical protein
VARIYVETLIKAPMDELWAATQDPAQHQRWDLRFTEIALLPAVGPDEPQSFTYALAIGPRRRPWLRIAGVGQSLGERSRPDGTRTSALGFRSLDRRSLLEHGRGWWRYVPIDEGTRFITGYDYTPGWGAAGPAVDRLFRPLVGWATAWSFDRLRLWLDHGVSPKRSLLLAGTDLLARIVVAATVKPRVLGLAVAAAAPALPGAPRARRCLRSPRVAADPFAQAPANVARVAP